MPTRALSRIFLISAFFFACLQLVLLTTDLPCCHASPNIDVRCDRTRVAPGRAFELRITISWPGAADDYIVEPPALVLPEGVAQVSSSFTSATSDQHQVLTYCYLLKAERRGTFTLTHMPIKYWARGAGQEALAATQELAVEAVRFPWLTQRLIWVLVIGAVLILSGVLSLAVATNRRVRRAASQADSRTKPDREDLSMRLTACRQCKLEGNYAGFYQAAQEIAAQLPGAEPALTQGLSATLERVRFGGYRPPAEELEALLRQLERRVGALAGDGDEILK
jgi:hypothetical protein